MEDLIQFGNRVINLDGFRRIEFHPKAERRDRVAVLKIFYGDDDAHHLVRGEDAESLWATLEISCGTRPIPVRDGVPVIPSPSRPLLVEEEANADPTGQPSPPCFARPARDKTAAIDDFVSLGLWDACSRDPDFTTERPVYAGLSLLPSQGLAALVWMAGNEQEGFDVGCRFWLPQAAVDRPENHGVPYRVWAAKGLVTITPGDVIDYAWIRADVNELAAEHDLAKLLVDPYNATKLAGELKEQDGLPVEYLRQGFLSLSAPTKSLLRLILSGRLRHGGNPILRWCVNNAVTHQDGKGGLKISAKASHGPVVGVSALVNAVAAASDPSRPRLFSDADVAKIIRAIRELEQRATTPDPAWIAFQTGRVIAKVMGGPGAGTNIKFD